MIEIDSNDNEIQKALLNWFYQNQRAMPWRENKDPYRIWVSEVMLQQTRVDTVIPYFLRFMEKFPCVQALADGEEREWMKAWEGLGYYSRIRNLHKGAREIMEHYAGKVPDRYEDLITIPGIGEYTAGAILSIAYNQNIPAVDGNVQRVVSRVFCIQQDIGLTETKNKIKTIATRIIPQGKASDFNQALMELGALICIPQNPRCPSCPLFSLCQARIHDLQDQLPIKTAKKKPKDVFKVVAVIYNERGQLLIRQRLDEGLLAALWEFPSWDAEKEELDKESVLFLTQSLRKIGLGLIKHGVIGRSRHTFTHMRWHMQGYWCIGRSEGKKIERCRWIAPEQINQYPFPTALKTYKEWVLSHMPINR